MSRSAIVAVILAASLPLLPRPASASPLHLWEHTDDITVNQTWPAGIHMIPRTIRVAGPNGPTLTLAPGCILRFGPGARLDVGVGDAGGLIAEGTPAHPIVFESNLPHANPGAWGDVNIGPTANGYMTRLSHCIVQDGGDDQSGGTLESIEVQNSGASFDHVLVRHAAGYGFHFETGARPARFTDNTVRGVGGTAMSIGANAVSAIGDGNRLTGNGTDRVEVQAEDVTRNATWPKLGVPYRVQGDIEVHGDNGPVLTIAPGTTVEMGNRAEFMVGNGSSGGLIAVGNPAEPITFTSLPNAPNPGEWVGLGFWQAANASQCQLSYANVDYAGGDCSHDPAAIYTCVSISVDHVAIRHSAGAGIYVSGENASPRISDMQYADVAGPELKGQANQAQDNKPALAVPSLDTIKRNIPVPLPWGN